MKIKIFKQVIWGLIGLAVFSSPVYAKVESLDKIVAIVDDDVIMQSQLDSRVDEVVKNIERRKGQQPPRATIVSQVLERLIMEDLQLQLANRYGIKADDEDLNQAVADVAKRNRLSLPQFMAVVKKEGLSFDTVRGQIRREMLITRVRQRVIGQKIHITDQEVNNFLNSDLGKMQLSEEYYLANILIPVSPTSSYEVIQKAEKKAKDIYSALKNGADFEKLAITSSSGDTALQGGIIGWRKAAQLPPPFDRIIQGLRKGDFTQPVSTSGGFIILKVLDKQGGTTHITDQISVRHILLKPSQVRSEAETKKLADRLYSRIMAGEDFAKLAKKFSDDHGSAAKGGDLNWVDPNALVPQFRKVMNETPVGQISEPFESSYGWHILQVLGRRSKDNSEDYLKQQAMNILYERKYDQELQVWLQQLRDEAYVEIKH